MRKLISILVLLGALSCSDEPAFAPPSPVSYTTLIYMAADNSMDQEVAYTLAQLRKGAQHSAGKLVVYLDRRNEPPELFYMNQEGKINKLKEYAEENSAKATTLLQAIADTKALLPSEKFGLVLWSHALGWVPAGFTPSAFQTPKTRYVGIDESPVADIDTVPSFMEIDAIANSLPDAVAEYIWFDACLMGNVEGLYELRRKAKFLIASPTEVLMASAYGASGVPYAKVLPYLFGGKDELQEACTLYFEHYKSQKHKILRSATISLLATDELDKLFLTTQTILRGQLQRVADMTVDSLQKYHTENIPPLFFDLGHFLQQVATAEAYADFQKQLNRTVLYKAATADFTIAEGNAITINPEHYSGLSTFVPLSALQSSSEYFYYFEKLAWSGVY